MQRYNHEELLYLYRQGNEYALQILHDEYLNIALYLYQKMFSSNKGIDKQEFIQIAMVNFYTAIDSYRSDQNCTLKTYLTIVIKNSILTRYKNTYQRDKKRYGQTISLNQEYSRESNYCFDDIVEDTRHKEFQPLQILMVREEVQAYSNNSKNLSSFEYQVFQLKSHGLTIKEISTELNCSSKKIYNALCRIKSKLN